MPKELESCVKQVKAKGGADNAWAVCRSSLGTDKQIKARRKKKSKKVRHKGQTYHMKG